MSSIDVPLLAGGGVRFFVDELPDDHIDLIDVLRSEIPPLQTWRECAVSNNELRLSHLMSNVSD